MPDLFISESKTDKESKTPSAKKEPSLEKGEHLFHDRNPLHAFRDHPAKVTFFNKDPEEKVILLVRRHPITNIGWMVVSLAMFFMPVILNFFPLLSSLPQRFQFIAILGWYMISVAFTFEKFLEWFFNVNIITDERVIEADFVNLIYREISEANISQIQDVTVVMGSVARTVFNYGDVVIQTASEVPRIVFEAVPKPDKVAKILHESRLEEEQEEIEGRIR